MSIDGQGTLQRRNIAENFNRLSRAHERYRQTTDGRTTTYSERELEFTFAKNRCSVRWPERRFLLLDNTSTIIAACSMIAADMDGSSDLFRSEDNFRFIFRYIRRK